MTFTGTRAAAATSREDKTHQLAGRKRGDAARTGANVPGGLRVGETR